MFVYKHEQVGLVSELAVVKDKRSERQTKESTATTKTTATERQRRTELEAAEQVIQYEGETMAHSQTSQPGRERERARDILG